MSTKSGVSTVEGKVGTTDDTAVATPSIHVTAAQSRVEQLRAMRESIPNFTVPPTTKEGRKLSAVSSLSPEFIELAAIGLTNATDVGVGTSPEDIRDLIAFANAYDPVADELETTTRLLRHTIQAARYKAGTAALAMYASLKRLVKAPEHAELATHLAHMSRALGMRERLARRKAAVAKRKAEPATTPVTPPVPTTPKL